MGAPARPQRACYGADTVTALDSPQTTSLTGPKVHEAPRRSGAPAMLPHRPWTPLPAWTNAALAEHLPVKRHRVEGLIQQELIVIVRRTRHGYPLMLDPSLVSSSCTNFAPGNRSSSVPQMMRIACCRTFATFLAASVVGAFAM